MIVNAKSGRKIAIGETVHVRRWEISMPYGGLDHFTPGPFVTGGPNRDEPRVLGAADDLVPTSVPLVAKNDPRILLLERFSGFQKRQMGYGAEIGNWAMLIEGESEMHWHSTKREALHHARVALTIRDWHDGKTDRFTAHA